MFQAKILKCYPKSLKVGVCQLATTVPILYQNYFKRYGNYIIFSRNISFKFSAISLKLHCSTEFCLQFSPIKKYVKVNRKISFRSSYKAVLHSNHICIDSNPSDVLCDTKLTNISVIRGIKTLRILKLALNFIHFQRKTISIY